MTSKKKPAKAKKAKAPSKPLPSITIDLLAKYQDELMKAFPNDEAIAYNSVKFTQLSVARHFGGARVNGKHFIYNPTDDSLIREDVLQWMIKKLKEG